MATNSFPVLTNDERYQRYAAWCGMLGVPAKSFNAWMSRKKFHLRKRHLCESCLIGEHNCTQCDCVCQEQAQNFYPGHAQYERQAATR